MALNIVFLIIYIFFSSIFDYSLLYYLQIFNCLLLIIIQLRKRVDIITPIFIFYIGVIITNIANMSLISKIGKVDFKTYSYIVPKYLDEATLIWVISCSLIMIGYDAARNRRFASLFYEIKSKERIKSIFYILLVVNLLSVLGMGLNFRSGLILRIFGLLNSIGILFFAQLWGRVEDKTYRTYAITLFILETYIALISSYLRFELILPTIYLYTGYFLGKRDIRYVLTYRILPLVVIMLAYALNFSSLQENRLNFIGAFTERSSSDLSDSRNSSALLDRSANLAQLTNVVKLVKQNGTYDGKASEPLVAALIPRFLWPDKPIIALGAWFALEIGTAYKNDGGRVNNSINMTIPGELYLDFGWPGLVIGSLLVGLFIAMLWNSTGFYSSQYNITGIIFGGYLYYVALLNFGADLQIMITIISTFIIFLIINKILKPR